MKVYSKHFVAMSSVLCSFSSLICTSYTCASHVLGSLKSHNICAVFVFRGPRFSAFLCTLLKSRSRWKRGLRSGSVVARLLILRVQIPPGTKKSVSFESCFLFPMQRSLRRIDQRSSVDCGVSQCDVYWCDRESPIMESL